MIDSTKSPTPAWQRYLLAGLVTVLVVVVAWFVWTKELHKGSSATSSSPPAAQSVVTHHSAPPTTAPVATATTVPGGIVPSPRNPFISG